MKNTSHSKGQRESDNHKGESGGNSQKGALGVSKKSAERHRKDESEGTDQNSTKKHGNSI